MPSWCIASLGMILCAIAMASGQICPPDWIHRPGGGSCYLPVQRGMKTWDEARRACQSRDGDLLKLDSVEEKDWIMELTLQYPASYEWWTGLNNKADLTVWVWADDSASNSTIMISLDGSGHKNDGIVSKSAKKGLASRWGSGEPNNFRNEERCAEIWDTLFNDKNCEQPLQYICERPKYLPLACDADDGWQKLTSGSCYKFFDDPVNEASITQYCSNADATPVLVNSDDMQQTLRDFVSYKERSIWIQVDPSSVNYWRSTQDQMSYRRSQSRSRGTRGRGVRSPALPMPTTTVAMVTTRVTTRVTTNTSTTVAMSTTSAAPEPAMCAMMNSTMTDANNWQTVNCEDRHAFVCRKPQGTCSPGWIQHQSTCILVYAPRPMTWNEGKGFCNLRGAQMLEPKVSGEFAFLKAVIPSTVASLWVGLSGTGNDWTWVSDGSSADTPNPGQTVSAEKQCGYINTDDPTGTAHAGDCGDVRAVACLAPTDKAIIQPPTIRPKYECSMGWVLHDMECYRLHAEVKVSWAQAKRKCQEQGAGLASVPTMEASNFLAGKMDRELWIGVNDRKTENSFTWLDDEGEISFTNWRDNEPSNNVIGGRYSENCVAMVNNPGEADHGKWVDYPCSFRLSFICQMPAEYNIALGKVATQSSVYKGSEPGRAIEGCQTHTWSGSCCAHTDFDLHPWWELDLGTQYNIGKVVIHRRYEASCVSCQARLRNYRLFISNTSGSVSVDDLVHKSTRPVPISEISIAPNTPKTGRYVRIDIPGRREYLVLCEVQVYRAKDVRKTALTTNDTLCFTDSRKWKGEVSHTISGRLCQFWVKDTPHSHSRHGDSMFSDGTQAAAMNYCRDPDSEGRPWCYTVDPDKRWEYCGVPACSTVASTSSTPEQEETVVSECGQGWSEDIDSGHCYSVGEPLSWGDAESTCKAQKSDLVVIAAEEERAFLLNLVTSDIWVGLGSKMAPSQHSVSSNESASTEHMHVYIRKLLQTKCLVLSRGGHIKGALAIDSCNQRKAYVCKRASKLVKFRTKGAMNRRMINRILDGTSFVFQFKGAGDAHIMLHTKGQSEGESAYEIVLCKDGGSTVAIINKKDGTKSKEIRLPIAVCDENGFNPFWISWNTAVSAGRGSDVGRNSIISTGLDPLAKNIQRVSIATGAGLNGFWTIPPVPNTNDLSSGDSPNLALGKPTLQSSVQSSETGANKAVDGCTSHILASNCCASTQWEQDPWWQVDLGKFYGISKVAIYRRYYDCPSCLTRMYNFRLLISAFSDSTDSGDVLYQEKRSEPPAVIEIPVPKGTTGRYVKIDIPGRSKILTLCEVQVTLDMDASKCGVGWDDTGETNGCFLFGKSPKPSWQASQDVCLSESAELAVIESAAEQLYIYEKTHLMPGLGVWIGYHGNQQDNEWQAVNDAPMNYTNWGPGERDDFSGPGQCAALKLTVPGAGRWTATACAQALRYVCKRKEIITTTTTTTTTSTTTTMTTATTTSTAPTATGTTVTGSRTTTQQLPSAVTQRTVPTPPTQMTVVTTSSTRCKSDWFSVDASGNCYYVGLEPAVSWFTASRLCKIKGGQLASVSSLSEQIALGAKLDEKFDYTGMWDGLWIGATDFTEGQWRFTDGAPWSSDIQWLPNQPDNFQGNEDCGAIAISPGVAGKLNDAPCGWDGIRGYLCKISNENTSSTVQSLTTKASVQRFYVCETGWLLDSVTGNCYKTFSDAKTWEDARQDCQSRSADLASIVSAHEQTFMKSIAQHVEDNGHLWVGARDTVEGQWTWSDGLPWYNAIIWKAGNPDNWRGAEDCGSILSGSRDTAGQLNDLGCSSHIPFMCKKEGTRTTGTIPVTGPTTNMRTPPSPGPVSSMRTPPLPVTSTTPASTTSQQHWTCGPWWETGPQYQYCYKFMEKLVTWADAEASCKEHSGHLASITSMHEQSYIAGRLQQLTGGSFWIGANDIALESGWQWVDGSPFTFLNWAPGEPSNYEGGNNVGMGEDCGSVVNDPQYRAQWNDLPCNSLRGYICKKKAMTTTVSTAMQETTTLPDAKVYGCPGNGWVDYQDSCYLVMQKEKGWEDAIRYCRKAGGDLASVNNADEQNFIFSQAPQGYCGNLWKNDTACERWAETGECDKNPVWMATRCQGACKKCMHNCRDKHTSTEQCSYWASIGECEANPTWMVPNCAQSCGVCRGAPARGFWIGLSDKAVRRQFMWSDHSKVLYSNWGIGEPLGFSRIAVDCVAMSMKDGKWNTGDCEESLPGFICEQPKLLIAKTTESPFSVGCTAGDNTFGYGSYCYFYSSDYKSWDEAKQYCEGMNGKLAVVTDRFTQSFVASELVNRLQNYWIGLVVDSGNISWVDSASIDYSNWDKGFATYSKAEGCDPDWTRDPQTGSCYRVMIRPLNWESARQSCQRENADLTSITSAHEQNFISGIIPESIPVALWVGAKDSAEEGRWEWTDTSPWWPDISWKPGNPDNWGNGPGEDCGMVLALEAYKGQLNDGRCGTTYSYICKKTGGPPKRCVSMTTYRPVGMWALEDCKDSRPFICQTLREGYTLPLTTTLAPTTLAPPTCPSDWSINESWCYKLSLSDDMMTWFDARRQCRLYGGDLVSVHSQQEFEFLLRLMIGQPDMAWIGLNDITSESAFTWSDGTPVNFIQWGANDPDNRFDNEHCVMLSSTGRHWFDANCHISRQYICKAMPGMVRNISRISTTAAYYNETCAGDDSWLVYEGQCYYLSEIQKNWFDARKYCMANGGDLVSIHGRAEKDFVLSQVSKRRKNAWSGLNDLDLDGTFKWTDGSPLDFEMWAPNEPNDVNGGEKCGNIKPWHGVWNDMQCLDELYFMCKRPIGQVQPKTQTTPQPIDGGCPQGYTPFGNKCFKVHKEDKKTWADALTACEMVGPGFGLASISSAAEQVTLTAGSPGNVYVGLNDLNDNNRFTWADNSLVSYTNWKAGEPNSVPGRHKEACVEMLPIGTWNDLSCNFLRGYICQGRKNPALTATTPTTASSDCPAGYQKFMSACYGIATATLSWDAAQEACEADGGNLISIRDIVEQAFATVLLFPDTPAVWIGFNQKETPGTFKWSDNSPVSYTRWGSNQERDENKRCVALENDFWIRRQCDDQLQSICKTPIVGQMTTTAITTTTTGSPKVCRDSSWYQYEQNCYYINLTERQTFTQIVLLCAELGMVPVSIHNKRENQALVRMLLKSLDRDDTVPHSTVWIGFSPFMTGRGVPRWLDGSPLEYTNWMPEDSSSSRFSLTCATMSPFSGQWLKTVCRKSRGYICKGIADADEPLTTTVSTSPVSTSTERESVTVGSDASISPTGDNVTRNIHNLPFKHFWKTEKAKEVSEGLTGGQIVGIVLGVLGILVVAAVVVYVFKLTRKQAATYNTDSQAFDNALYHKSRESISLEGMDT